ncbi:MAG: hypothetical protein ACI957_002397 [Verrucomicrobiales bacterium]
MLGEIKESTDRISQDMEVIKLQNQLKQLDREWVMERESYIYRTKDGRMRLPGADDLFIPVIIIIGGAFLFIAAIYERTLIALLESIFIPPLESASFRATKSS